MTSRHKKIAGLILVAAISAGLLLVMKLSDSPARTAIGLETAQMTIPRGGNEQETSAAPPETPSAQDTIRDEPVQAQAGRRSDELAHSQTEIRSLRWTEFKYPDILEKTLPDGRHLQWVANQLIIGLKSPEANQILNRWLATDSAYTVEWLTDDAVILSWSGSTPERFFEEKEKWTARLGIHGQAEENGVIRALTEPTDPLYSSQWYFQTIDAAEAWQIRTDATGITIAVLDSGIAMDLPELAQAIAVNQNEIAGNGADDDGNGFSDDVRGWDFVDNDNDPTDMEGHGTLMAGIIGARWDNETGIAGVCRDIRILPVRFLDEEGYGLTSDEIRALDYILQSGATIVNASFGGPFSGATSRNQYRKLRDAGIWVVAAAGNDGVNTDESPNYPSSYDLENILSVGALGSGESAAQFSNYGSTSVDIFAPGVGILSTEMDGAFGGVSGTSPAAAITSGALALVLAEFPGADPATIRARMITRSRYSSALDGKCVSSGILSFGHAILRGDGLIPVLTASPESVTVDAGATVSLSVDFIAYAPASVQWYVDDTLIPDATSSTYSFPAWDKASEGNYFAEVTTIYGSTRSASAVVSVVEHLPEVVSISEEAFLAEGRTFQLSVFASGSKPLSYQWLFNGAPVSNATGSVYSVSKATLSMEGNYSVRISNRFGWVDSPVVRVTQAPTVKYDWRDLSAALPASVRKSGNLFWDIATGLVSPDLKRWLNMNQQLQCVPAFANGAYWSVNRNSEFLRSEDGTHWTFIRDIPEDYYDRVVAGNGFVLLMSDDPVFQTNYDYVRFNVATLAYSLPRHAGYLQNVFFDGELFRASIAESGNYFSTDGIDWQKSAMETPVLIHYDALTGTYIGTEQTEQTNWRVVYSQSTNLRDWTRIDAFNQNYLIGYSPGTAWGPDYRYDLQTGVSTRIPYVERSSVLYADRNHVLRRLDNEVVLTELDTGLVTRNYATPGSFVLGDDAFVVGDTLYQIAGGNLYQVEIPGSRTFLKDVHAVTGPGLVRYWSSPEFAFIRSGAGRYFLLYEGSAFEEIYPDKELLLDSPFAMRSSGVPVTESDGQTWYSLTGENWYPAPVPDATTFLKSRDTILLLHLSGSGYSATYTIYRRDPQSGEWSETRTVPRTNFMASANQHGFCIYADRLLFTSEDGVTWDTTPYPGEKMLSLKVQDGLFFAEIDFNDYEWASLDGRSWFPADSRNYPVYRTSTLVYNKDGLVAKADGSAFPQSPLLYITGDRVNPSPATWTIGLGLDQPATVSHVDLFENDELVDRQYSGNPAFVVNKSDLGWSRFSVEAVYSDGFSLKSKSFDLAVSASVSSEEYNVTTDAEGNPVRAPSPGIEYFPFGDALAARIIRDASSFKSVDGKEWTPLPELSTYAPGVYDPVSLADGSIAFPFNVPFEASWATVVGNYLSPGSDEMQPIYRPRENLIAGKTVSFSGRYFVIFKDGEVHEFTGAAGWRIHAQIDVSMNGSYSITQSRDMVMISNSTGLYASDDGATFHKVVPPDGWNSVGNMRFRHADGIRNMWLSSPEGSFTPIVSLPPVNFPWRQLSDTVYWSQGADNTIWFCNLDNRVFPISIDKAWPLNFSYPRESYAFMLNEELILTSNSGEIRTLVQHDFAATDLRYTGTVYGVSNELNVSFNLSDRGILDIPEGKVLAVDCYLHQGAPDSPGIPLQTVLLPIGGLRPYQAYTYSFSIAVPAGLQLGSYSLSIELDADNAFQETIENNNTAVSPVFVYNPKVGILLTVQGNGWVEANTAEASLPYGARLIMNAVADDGAAFITWDGSTRSRSRTLDVVVNQSLQLKAHFVPRGLAALFPELDPVGGERSYAEAGGPHITPVLRNWNVIEGKSWAYIPDVPELPEARLLYDMSRGWLSRAAGTNWYFNYQLQNWEYRPW